MKIFEAGMTRLLAARAGMISAVLAIALCNVVLKHTKPFEVLPIPLWLLGLAYVCALAIALVGGTMGWVYSSGKVAFVGAWILLFPICYFVALVLASFFIPGIGADF